MAVPFSSCIGAPSSGWTRLAAAELEPLWSTKHSLMSNALRQDIVKMPRQWHNAGNNESWPAVRAPLPGDHHGYHVVTSDIRRPWRVMGEFARDTCTKSYQHRVTLAVPAI